MSTHLATDYGAALLISFFSRSEGSYLLLVRDLHSADSIPKSVQPPYCALLNLPPPFHFISING